MQAELKICRYCKAQFDIGAEDSAMYSGMDLPLPEICADCRLKHLFSFWSFGRFRKTKSALSGKGIITTLPESYPYPIYERAEWISDAWDALSYGRDYDPEKPFFEQFAALKKEVPHPHQTAVNVVNCDWSDDIWDSRECYLCRAIIDAEYLTYCYRTFTSKNCIDMVYCFESELSYDCLFCFKCYKTRYAFNSRNCIDSMFLYDCRNVQNCFMCWNLRNKEYCIMNEQYTREEYQKKLAEFDTRSFKAVEALKKQFDDLVAREAIHRQDFNTQAVNCTGNLITECRNCDHCAYIERSENCRNCWRIADSKDIIDLIGCIAEHSGLGVLGDHMYDSIVFGHCFNCRYSAYISFCEDCENCFGCVGVRNKQYCILNKQYSKEEYEKLVARIKADMKTRGEWGKFFPMELAGFGYNLSLANIMFPAKKEEVQAMGGLWDNAPDQGAEGMPTDQLPDRIDDVQDSITTQPLICPETGLRYNIAPHELAFYRERGIPLPRLHFDQRILKRFGILARMMRPREGSCTFCKKDVLHYFPLDLGYQKIACVDCYQQRVS